MASGCLVGVALLVHALGCGLGFAGGVVLSKLGSGIGRGALDVRSLGGLHVLRLALQCLQDRVLQREGGQGWGWLETKVAGIRQL